MANPLFTPGDSGRYSTSSFKGAKSSKKGTSIIKAIFGGNNKTGKKK